MQEQISNISRPEITEAVTRGVIRLFHQMGLNCVTELSLKTGRRVDVMGLDRKGLFSAVEVKSSVEDFRTDGKWEDYLPFCDQFFFAVSPDFPTDILPPETGLIMADAYGAEILKPSLPGNMNPARRKALTLRYARHAAGRLMALGRPEIPYPGIRNNNP